MKRTEKIIWSLFAMGILALLLTSIFRVPESKLPIGRAFSLVKFMTGTSSHYGFFSPNINNALDIRLEAYDKNNKRISSLIKREASRDAELRAHSGLRLLSNYYQNQVVRRALSASFVAHLLDHNPEAHRVLVKASAVVVPSLRDYRNGKRTEYKEMYSAEYVRPEVY